MATLWHKVKLPAISPNPSPVVGRNEQTLLIASERGLSSVVPTAGGRSSLRSTLPAQMVGSPQSNKQPTFGQPQGLPFPCATPTPPFPPSCSPPGTPGFPRLAAPQPRRSPHPVNFSRRPSAARCCPLTAGPGASLPSPGPGLATLPPRRAAANRCQPRPARPHLAALCCHPRLSAPPNHQPEETTTRNNSSKPSPTAHFPLNSLPALGLPGPVRRRAGR